MKKPDFESSKETLSSIQYHSVSVRRAGFVLFLLATLFAGAAGAGGQTIVSQTLDAGTGGSTGLYTSQAVVNGNPAIAYYNITDRRLMFARNSAADGSGTWIVTTADHGDSDLGEFASLSVVNGNPAISYYDATYGYLKYVRANDANGTNWGTPLILDNAGDVGQTSSLAIVNGNPALSYYDDDNGFLKYVRANDATGSSWQTPVFVDMSGFVSLGNSLVVVEGNPAIGYHDFFNGYTKYIRAVDVNGVNWGDSVIVDSGFFSTDSSFAIINGNPAMSYYDGTHGALKYVRAADSTGTNWDGPETIDTDGVSANSSLEFVNGSPAISYPANGELMYVRATDATGASWGTPGPVDTSGVGLYSSLKMINGRPAISYFDEANGDLKYVRAADAGGVNWPGGTVADAGVQCGEVGPSSSQIVVNGKPAVSYRDITNGQLKYVRSNDAAGMSWGTPITVDSQGDVGDYPSLTIVNGKPAVSYYDATNGDLKYVRAIDAEGTSWAPSLTVDSNDDVGLNTSLKVINGNPAISYFDSTTSQVRYVRADDVNGTTWSSSVVVEMSSFAGPESLADINGNPALGYFDFANGQVKYIRANDASGSSWGTPVVLDTDVFLGRGSVTLIAVNGKPAVSYVDDGKFELRYVRSNDITGASWGMPVVLADANTLDIVPGNNSMTLINGNPAISYARFDGLRYIRATDPDGINWASPVSLNDFYYYSWYVSLAEVSGNPAVSYFDYLHGDLKWITLVPGPTPTPTPAPVMISGGVSYCPNSTLVQGVTMSMTGSTTASTMTDGSGAYALTAATGDSVTVTPAKAPLASGTGGINNIDVLAVQRHFLAVAFIPPGCRLAAGDANGDSQVNSTDVIAIQRFFLGLSTGIGNTGKYQFSPNNRAYSSLGANQTGQDYVALIFGDVVP